MSVTTLSITGSHPGLISGHGRRKQDAEMAETETLREVSGTHHRLIELFCHRSRVHNSPPQSTTNDAMAGSIRLYLHGRWVRLHHILATLQQVYTVGKRYQS